MLILKYVIIYIVLAFLIITLSRFLKFFDKPNDRTLHSTPVINTGGLMLYLFFLSIISQDEFNHNIELIVTIGFFVSLVGFVDDRMNLNPSTKILFLIFPSIYLILKSRRSGWSRTVAGWCAVTTTTTTTTNSPSSDGDGEREGPTPGWKLSCLVARVGEKRILDKAIQQAEREAAR